MTTCAKHECVHLYTMLEGRKPKFKVVTKIMQFGRFRLNLVLLHPHLIHFKIDFPIIGRKYQGCKNSPTNYGTTARQNMESA